MIEVKLRSGETRRKVYYSAKYLHNSKGANADIKFSIK